MAKSGGLRSFVRSRAISAGRSVIALVLAVLLIPMSWEDMLAQQGADAQPAVSASDAQPLTAEQLDQLVARGAPYPNALIAQILAASTHGVHRVGRR